MRTFAPGAGYPDGSVTIDVFVTPARISRKYFDSRK
jgi:hypothetical protein